MENRDNPLIGLKIFRYPKLSETHKGFSTIWFCTLRQNNFQRKLLIPATSFTPKNFRKCINLLKHRIVPLWFFSIPWNNNFSLKNRVFPCWAKHFSIPWTYWYTEGSSTNWFGAVRQNIFDRKPWYVSLLLSPTFFDIKNFANHRRFPIWKLLGTVRQQTFYKKSWYSPLGHKIFQYPKHTDTQPGLLRSDSVLWGKTIWTVTRETRPLFYP